MRSERGRCGEENGVSSWNGVPTTISLSYPIPRQQQQEASHDGNIETPTSQDSKKRGVSGVWCPPRVAFWPRVQGLELRLRPHRQGPSKCSDAQTH
eukprot:g53813.t1